MRRRLTTAEKVKSRIEKNPGLEAQHRAFLESFQSVRTSALRELGCMLEERDLGGIQELRMSIIRKTKPSSKADNTIRYLLTLDPEYLTERQKELLDWLFEQCGITEEARRDVLSTYERLKKVNLTA